MQSLFRLFIVFFITLFIAGCVEETPLSSELTADEIALAKTSDHKDRGCRCGKIKARLSATGEINPPLLTATGEMRGNLRGTVNYVGYLEDFSPITSNFGNDPINPSASFSGTWTLTTDDGDLTFRDIGTFEQVPNGIGTSFSQVIDGTGCYSGASGYLFINIITDETGLNFEEHHRGEIFCQRHTRNTDN